MSPVPLYVPVTAAPPTVSSNGLLSANELAESILQDVPPVPTNRPPLVAVRQDDANLISRRPPLPANRSYSARLRDPTVSPNSSGGTIPPSNRNTVSPSETSKSPSDTSTSVNRQSRMPFRPLRPTQVSSTSQLQHSVNVCVKQLREYNRINKDTLKAIVASNRRYTEIENSLQQTNNKVDQILAVLAQGNVTSTTSEAAGRLAPDAAYETVDQIAPQFQVETEFL